MNELKEALVSIVIVGAISNMAFGHTGSTWHGTSKSATIGLNTVFLEPNPDVPNTKFVFRYPTQPNTHQFVIGDEFVAMVFRDDALDDGFFTESELKGFASGKVYDYYFPLEIAIGVTKPGYYHFGFGPGPGTSILVIESAPDGTIEVVSPNGGSVTYVQPGTTGDIHIIEHPRLGYDAFVGWIGVILPDAREVYERLGIARGALPPLDADRASALAHVLSDFGYINEDDIPDPFPEGVISAPLQVFANGLGIQSFLTAFLRPGQYCLSYDALADDIAIAIGERVALQVTRDNGYVDRYVTDQEIIARAEYSLDETPDSILFEVEEADYYHIMYGPGDDSFLFHLLPNDLLPVKLESLDGAQIDFIRRLGGLNTIIWDISRPFKRRAEVCFPCKLVDQDEFHDLGIMSNIFIPISGFGWGELMDCLGTKILAVAGDLDGDGAVGALDLLILLSQWGECLAQCCVADLDGDGTIGASDLLALLANWGPCP